MVNCCLFTDLAPRGSHKGTKQYVCKCCGAVHTDKATRKRKLVSGVILSMPDDRKGRARVYLGVNHPYANSAGWQYRYRYRVMEALGRQLRPDEHVHHIDGDCTNDELINLLVVVADEHGRMHRCGNNAPVIAQWIDGRGFVELVNGEWESEPVKVDEVSEVPF